jgi:hypothetical protein
MSAPAILYVGYGLPFKVFYHGSQPLYTLLSSRSQYSRLSIESDIMLFLKTNLHRSSLSTISFLRYKMTLDTHVRVCQSSVQHTPVVKLLFIINYSLDTCWDCSISVSRLGCHLHPMVLPQWRLFRRQAFACTQTKISGCLSSVHTV